LHLPAKVPVKTFWSVIVSDAQTRSVPQTDRPFPSVSSQDKKPQVNDDGSADAYFGPGAPAGKESNRVPTTSGKGWFTTPRLCGPPEPWFNKAWRPGGIEAVG
jgi:hypothetical protein